MAAQSTSAAMNSTHAIARPLVALRASIFSMQLRGATHAVPARIQNERLSPKATATAPIDACDGDIDRVTESRTTVERLSPAMMRYPVPPPSETSSTLTSALTANQPSPDAWHSFLNDEGRPKRRASLPSIIWLTTLRAPNDSKKSVPGTYPEAANAAGKLSIPAPTIVFAWLTIEFNRVASPSGAWSTTIEFSIKITSSDLAPLLVRLELPSWPPPWKPLGELVIIVSTSER
mmetsp:Transcript_41376/g.83514  ORF Transcript_41376/g.83514 Transcript_41376/m.83514 type:complete len:233 (-) Transcript_41376:131-829(-)